MLDAQKKFKKRAIIDKKYILLHTENLLNSLYRPMVILIETELFPISNSILLAPFLQVLV